MTTPLPPARHTSPGRPAVVLLVDDSRTMRGVLRLQLAADGYEIVEAENAGRALALARLLRPAAAVIDVNLAEEDGIALVALLRAEADMTVRHVGVLLVSGDEVDTYRARAAAVGVDLCLRKPLAGTALRDAVCDLVGRRER